MAQTKEQLARFRVDLFAFTDEEARDFTEYIRSEGDIQDARQAHVKFAAAVHIVPIAVFVSKAIASASIGYVIKLTQGWIEKKWKASKAKPGQQVIIYGPGGEVVKVIRPPKRQSKKQKLVQ